MTLDECYTLLHRARELIGAHHADLSEIEIRLYNKIDRAVNDWRKPAAAPLAECEELFFEAARRLAAATKATSIEAVYRKYKTAGPKGDESIEYEVGRRPQHRRRTIKRGGGTVRW